MGLALHFNVADGRCRYNFVNGQQHMSVLRSRQAIGSLYNAGAGGIPGNSDAGAMEANILVSTYLDPHLRNLSQRAFCSPWARDRWCACSCQSINDALSMFRATGHGVDEC